MFDWCQLSLEKSVTIWLESKTFPIVNWSQIDLSLPSAPPPDWLQSRTLTRVRKTCRGRHNLYPLVNTSNRRGCPSQVLRSSRGSMRSRWRGWRWRYSYWKMKLRGEIGLWTLPLTKKWKGPCKHCRLFPKTCTNTSCKLITYCTYFMLWVTKKCCVIVLN